jgi:transposase-like protein
MPRLPDNPAYDAYDDVQYTYFSDGRMEITARFASGCRLCDSQNRTTYMNGYVPIYVLDQSLIRPGDKITYTDQYGWVHARHAPGQTRTYPVVAQDIQERNTVTNIADRIKATQSTLAELLETKQAIDKLGKDAEYPVESVIFFTRTFGRGSIEYRYVAIKTETNRWYVTGRDTSRSGMSWDDLVETHLIPADRLEFATQWEVIR